MAKSSTALLLTHVISNLQFVVLTGELEGRVAEVKQAIYRAIPTVRFTHRIAPPTGTLLELTFLKGSYEQSSAMVDEVIKRLLDGL